MTGLMEKRELLQSGSTADVYRTDDPAVVRQLPGDDQLLLISSG